MKKFNLLVALFLMCFAGLASAATITMSGPTGDSSSNFILNNNTSSVQGVNVVSGSFEYSWGIEVDPSIQTLAITVENPSGSFNLSSIELVDDSDAGNNWSGVDDGSGEWSLSVMLLSTTTYTMTIIGEVVGDGDRTVTTTVSAVPVPAAVWLFGSALVGLVGISRRKSGSMLSA